MKRAALLATLWIAVLADPLFAALIVNPPQPITRQVTVQLIQTALDNGTSPATAFGNASQRATIEAGLDTIWAQAGIDINVLPTVNHYNDTFAYQGTAGAGTRPGGDLDTIFANAASAGVLNPDPLTLNLVFVNVVPAFTPLNENTAAGYARIGGNGITGYVGDNLLTFANGLDVISAVFAHEIGHNLGLSHTADGIANLMSPNGTSQQLSTGQITAARSSSFARAYTPVIAGDYNQNGVVDAADYVVWRNTLGQSGSGLLADGNNNGSVDTGDFTVWRSHFGSATGTGSGVPITSDRAGLSTPGISAVPEANGLVYLLTILTVLLAKRPSKAH